MIRVMVRVPVSLTDAEIDDMARYAIDRPEWTLVTVNADDTRVISHLARRVSLDSVLARWRSFGCIARSIPDQENTP